MIDPLAIFNIALLTFLGVLVLCLLAFCLLTTINLELNLYYLFVLVRPVGFISIVIMVFSFITYLALEFQ